MDLNGKVYQHANQNLKLIKIQNVSCCIFYLIYFLWFCSDGFVFWLYCEVLWSIPDSFAKIRSWDIEICTRYIKYFKQKNWQKQSRWLPIWYNNRLIVLSLDHGECSTVWRWTKNEKTSTTILFKNYFIAPYMYLKTFFDNFLHTPDDLHFNCPRDVEKIDSSTNMGHGTTDIYSTYLYFK